MDTNFNIESGLSEIFTSVFDGRRTKRKEKGEDNIEWCLTEKPDEADVASRMDSIIDKLKRQFKEKEQ
jgi:uncharacterized ferredoxin-like protein